MDELRTKIDEHASDPDAIPDYTDLDPSDPLRKENRGSIANTGVFEVHKPGAATALQRQKYIERMTAELESRGVSTADMVDHWMERGALASEGEHVPEGADDFDFGDKELEYRHLGLTLTPAQQAALGRTMGQAFTSPAAAVHGTPEQEIGSAVNFAAGANRIKTFIRLQGERAFGELTPAQRVQASRLISLDNYEAEAQRKTGQEAANWQAQADRLRPTIDPAASQDPKIQAALAEFKRRVTPIQARLSEGAGVDPTTFRQPAGGIYQRAIPVARQQEVDVERAQRMAAAGETTTPRTGLARTLFGQRRSALAAAPEGAEAPTQGPVNLQTEPGRGGTGSLASTQVSGSAKRATGSAQQYIEDNAIAAAAIDAGDKAGKAANNRVYQAVANTGQELAPTEKAPLGKRELRFNNAGQVVDAPPPGQGDQPGVRRFAVSPDAEALVKRHQAAMARMSAPESKLGQALSTVGGKVTAATLGNPLIAPVHAFREASAIGTNAPPNANVLQKAAGGLPFYSGAETLIRANRLKMDSPDVVAALQHGAEHSWLRIEDPRATGAAAAGHRILFGPNGQDTKLRVLAFLDFKQDRVNKGLSTSGADFDAAARHYVVSHAGEPHLGARGTVMQALSATQPFVQTHVANLGTGLRALGGEGGLTQATPGQRLTTALRGPLGKVGTAAALSYAASGHKPQSADLELGIYRAPDGSIHHFRGSPDDAREKFGAGTREITIRDPGMQLAGRVLANAAAAPPGHRLSELARGGVNAAASLAVGPAAGAAFGLATGKQPYLGRSGDVASEPGGPTYTPDEGLAGRFKAAALNVNSALSGAAGGGSLSGAVPVLASRPAKDYSVATRLADPGKFVDQVRMAISSSQGDSAQINKVADAAIARLHREPDINADYYAAQIERARGRAINAPGVASERRRNLNPDVR